MYQNNDELLYVSTLIDLQTKHITHKTNKLITKKIRY